MPSVVNKPFMLSVMLDVVMLSVVAPEQQKTKKMIMLIYFFVANAKAK
jgi:hypothetical protein